jgi:hypothetical protein
LLSASNRPHRTTHQQRVAALKFQKTCWGLVNT